jgi:Flp pilus assembly pilin Flp
MLETYEKNSRKKLIATVVAVIVIAGVVVLADMLKSKDSTADTQATSQTLGTNTDTTSTDTMSDTSTSTNSDGLKDGTYSASASYSVPPGQESIKVSLILSGGTVTDVSVVNSGNDRESAEFQDDFTSSYKSKVVGQKISGLQISSVAGASDTTEGFNQALSQIASEAQA